jgi:hypothetical protein
MSPTLNLTSEEYDCVFLACGFVKSVGAEKAAKKVQKEQPPYSRRRDNLLPLSFLTDTTFHSIQLRRMETSVTIKSMLQLPATFIGQRKSNDSSSFLLWKLK